MKYIISAFATIFLFVGSGFATVIDCPAHPDSTKNPTTTKVRCKYTLQDPDQVTVDYDLPYMDGTGVWGAEFEESDLKGHTFIMNIEEGRDFSEATNLDPKNCGQVNSLPYRRQLSIMLIPNYGPLKGTVFSAKGASKSWVELFARSADFRAADAYRGTITCRELK